MQRPSGGLVKWTTRPGVWLGTQVVVCYAVSIVGRVQWVCCFDLLYARGLLHEGVFHTTFLFSLAACTVGNLFRTKAAVDVRREASALRCYSFCCTMCYCCCNAMLASKAGGTTHHSTKASSTSACPDVAQMHAAAHGSMHAGCLWQGHCLATQVRRPCYEVPCGALPLFKGSRSYEDLAHECTSFWEPGRLRRCASVHKQR